MYQDNRMSRMSYQPSHLEYKEWGKLLSWSIHSLVHTAESDIFLDISAFYDLKEIRRDTPNMIE